MADFGKFRITNDGIDLEYKAQAGKKLNFTKFVLGDGNYSGAIKELHDVVHKVMDTDITRMNIQTLSTSKKISIGFNIDTLKITTGFYLREIGLFAEDPDTGDDVLVFYGNSGETADYISSSSSSTISEKLVDLEVYISDVDNITAVIDTSMVYASEQELDTLKNKLKSNTFTIPTSAWISENGLYVVTIVDTSVTANDMSDVAIDSTSYSIAEEAGVKSYTTEIVGGIKLYADSIPTGTITGKYAVDRRTL